MDFSTQYINGEWVKGASEKTVENINPYSGEQLTTIYSVNEDDVDRAYQAAKEAQSKWEKEAPAVRQAYLEKLKEVVKQEKQMIVDWLIKEAGSTRSKAEVEIEIALGIIQESISFPNRMKGQILPSQIGGKENYVYRMPKGVIAMIGPWNFPFHLCMRTVAPAFATGNTVVIKPASETPVTSGLLLAYLFEKAEFPAGTVNVTVGRGSEIGDSFVTHPVPELISFTGSTEVGSYLAELGGKHLKDTTLELGGNNAMLVLNDADIEQAVNAAVFGKFLHQGQICMSINRIILEEEVYEEFVQKFVEKVKTLKIGDPAAEDTVIGPLINDDQIERIQNEVEESLKQGAHAEVKGEVNGRVMGPTVLTNVTNEMPIARNEIFGPVAPILKVESVEEAIELANDTPYGLTASVFTADRYYGMEVGRKIETGMVHVNDQPVNDEAHVAFGGEKDSGLGRFGGEWVLDKMTTDQWISVQAEDRSYPF
ncbi:aldehyde dehydrogenase family protein [Salsuginibacillus kocurii]|uniref:aldehyde dehydrogenase family protein n=1 Tax=Salsuginibacillus kocurii TaxID=427078 RepID=UPI000370A3B6|nr:aldehyde dehydrogenase family protein [Salsuginibacillus kocurii]